MAPPPMDDNTRRAARLAIAEAIGLAPGRALEPLTAEEKALLRRSSFLTAAAMNHAPLATQILVHAKVGKMEVIGE